MGIISSPKPDTHTAKSGDMGTLNPARLFPYTEVSHIRHYQIARFARRYLCGVIELLSTVSMHMLYDVTLSEQGDFRGRVTSLTCILVKR